VVSLDNTQPMSSALLVERMTALAPDRMAEVCQALEVAVECD
jgi:mRNA-degrading endonuclease toxin of MazEF toxin-antitoxin module